MSLNPWLTSSKISLLIPGSKPLLHKQHIMYTNDWRSSLALEDWNESWFIEAPSMFPANTSRDFCYKCVPVFLSTNRADIPKSIKWSVIFSNILSVYVIFKRFSLHNSGNF